MENRYYDVVIAEMQSFLDENGFTKDADCFKNDKKALKVSFDEEKSLYNLYVADIEEDRMSDFVVASSYLFDDSQSERDAVSVGMDFVDTLRKALGVKAKRTAANVSLPVNDSNSMGVTALTNKLLNIYPSLKDIYKYETEKNGKYLYLDFCTKYVVPEVRNTLDTGAKKQIKKLIDMFMEFFVQGDRATTNLTVAILSAAIGTDGERFKKAADQMEEQPALITAINQTVAILVKNKKFKKAMNFEG